MKQSSTHQDKSLETFDKSVWVQLSRVPSKSDDRPLTWEEWEKFNNERLAAITAAAQKYADERYDQGYQKGLVATPFEQLEARTKWAVKLKGEGKTVREIVEELRLKSPGSVSWLLKRHRLRKGASSE